MSTSNTCTTGPPSRTVVAERDVELAAGDAHAARWSSTTPRLCATAAAAHAPVPHDSVSPDAALPDAHVDDVGRVDAHELDVGALREAGVELDARAVRGDAARPRGR